MKLVILMYLKEDEKCVNRLLGELDIQSFSRLPVEGHGPGATGGWYPDTPPYQSQMLVSVLPNDQAAALSEAVAGCTGVADPRHPVHAVVLGIEQYVCCENHNSPEGK